MGEPRRVHFGELDRVDDRRESQRASEGEVRLFLIDARPET